MAIRTDHVRRFQAQSPDGQLFDIDQFQSFVVGDGDSATTEARGIKSLRTSDGKPVQYLKPKKYRIRGLELTSNDPNAP
jgi:hypothetical protein